MTEQIREAVEWGASSVADVGTRRVRDVALAGDVSRNGYRYGAGVLERAVPLYENRPVFLDHADTVTRPFDRSARDLVGYVVAAHSEDGRIRGDIEVLATEAGDTFLALAASGSEAVGMSHVVTVKRASDGTVEEILEVVSVDAVAFPATNATFAEQRGAVDGDVVGAADDASDERWRTRCLAVIAERRELEARLGEAERQVRRGEREGRIRQLCAAAGIAVDGLGTQFAGLVVRLDDERQGDAFVQERIEFVRRMARPRPRSDERCGSRRDVDVEWVRAIRGV